MDLLSGSRLLRVSAGVGTELDSASSTFVIGVATAVPVVCDGADITASLDSDGDGLFAVSEAILSATDSTFSDGYVGLCCWNNRQYPDARQIGPPGWVDNAADCDDSDARVHPGVFLIVEVKAGDNDDVQDAPAQVVEYMDILAPNGRLRRDVASSYQTVARQLGTLGFAAPDPAGFQPGMPVLGLVALCDYPSARPEKVQRARALGATLARPLRLVMCETGEGLGPVEGWEPL